MISSESSAYSFADVYMAIVGPNIVDTVTGAGEEGITVAYDGDSAVLTMGADGSGMYSMRVAQNGTITVRLLKGSPFNKVLSDNFWYQRGSTSLVGRNKLVITNQAGQDLITATGCGYRKHPNITYAVEGGVNEWEFLCQRIITRLGPGVATQIG